MSDIEQTLSIIKPDAIERNLESEIKKEFVNKGFKIVKEKKIHLTKSEAEINLMKGAASISPKAMKVAIESINPGVRQCDAVGEIQKASFRGTPGIGGDYASIATLLPTGK